MKKGNFPIPKLNKQTQNQKISEQSEAVRGLQKKLRMQAMTVAASVALVLVLVFAMTAAWYTNVAKTSDLTFQAEAWGYEESRISIAETPIVVSPGSSGFVPLTIDNSDRIEGVEIGVTISKRNIADAELQKRIFFYADTSAVQNPGSIWEQRIQIITPTPF